MDGEGRADRRARLPDGRAAARAWSTRSPRRASSATWCSARRSPSGRATTAGHGTEAELELLTVHGILHLLGYDHAEPEEHKEMFGLQDRAARGLAGGVRPPTTGDQRRCLAARRRRRPRRPGRPVLRRRRRAHVVLPRPRRGARGEGRPGARRLVALLDDPPPLPQHRAAAAAALRDLRDRARHPPDHTTPTTAPGGQRCSPPSASMLVVSFVAIGVGAAHPRPAARRAGRALARPRR